jgi:hypothetical protein
MRGHGVLTRDFARAFPRTGIVAALVLGLLGVGEDDIVADSALTARATDG